MWLRERDRNTCYFHIWASHLNKKNKIESICNAKGEQVQGTREICNVAKAYFQELFHSEFSLDSDGVSSIFRGALLMR